jgi:hypothetical protein
MRRPWAGVIALLNTETTDGRIVRDARWSLNVPVLLEAESQGSRSLIGAATWIGKADDTVFASGWVTLDSGGLGVDPGRHACGIDLTDTDVISPDHDNDRIVIKGGRIVAITVYRSGDPAWPDCHIEVIEQ